MNVQELIDALITYPPELVVMVRDARNGCCDELSIYPHGITDTFSEVSADEEAGEICDMAPGTAYVEGVVG